MNKSRILFNILACLALLCIVVAINSTRPAFSKPDITTTPSHTPVDRDYLPYIALQYSFTPNPATLTLTPSMEPTPSATPSSTATGTSTASATSTSTHTPTATSTNTPTATPTSTSTSTPTHTPTASATTEPGIDVAVLIDLSDSMANGTCNGGDYPCVYNCNVSATCQPFESIIASTRNFLDAFGPNDRITVIPFAQQAGYCINPGDVWPDCEASAYDPSNGKFGDKYVPLTDDLDAADTFINNLIISIPEWASDPPGTPPDYPIPACPGYDDNPPAGASGNDFDPRQCTNTNLGGAMHAAATELLKESTDRQRVIVVITDGAPNASGLGAEGPTYGTALQLGFCPQYTWQAPPPTGPFCRAPTPVLSGAGRHISTSVDYDAVDYLLDWSDFTLLSAPNGNDIQAYTIGIGNQVINTSLGQPDIGERVLRYIAAAGDDGDLATDPCSAAAFGASCGNYTYASDSDDLDAVLQDIAQRIFE